MKQIVYQGMVCMLDIPAVQNSNSMYQSENINHMLLVVKLDYDDLGRALVLTENGEFHAIHPILFEDLS